MSDHLIPLKWQRPDTVEYPKVWRIFQARDLDSNNLVEYHIQDLPESLFEAATEHMLENFLRDEPMNECLGAHDDPLHAADTRFAHRSLLPQKATLACFRAGSNEIVGVCFGFVLSKGENFFEEFSKNSKSPTLATALKICKLPYERSNFDQFEYYDVNKYYSELGLSVDKRYRGRNIGYHLLIARQEFCRAFGIKVQSMGFSSDFSNRCADKAGFELNASISFDEIDKLHPEFRIKNINSKAITVKSQRIS